MTELIVTALLIGHLQVTAYRSVPNQTDSSPWITSIGERVNNHGVAVSQDLLKSGRVRYGDILYIEGFGFKVVNDCMNARMKNAVDIWVPTKDEERKVGVRKLKVWRIICSHETKKLTQQRKGQLIGDSFSELVSETLVIMTKTLKQIQTF